MYVKLLPSHPPLCNPMDNSPPGSSVHGIFQAKIMEWVAMPSSRDLAHPGIMPTSLMFLELAAGFFTTSTTGNPDITLYPQNVFCLLTPGESVKRKELSLTSIYLRAFHYSHHSHHISVFTNVVSIV